MKKEKRTEDIFETRIWAGTAVTDPYQVLAEIFSASGFYSLKQTVRRVIESAMSKGIYDDRSPADVVLCMRWVVSLIKASHILKDVKRSKIEVEEKDLLNPAFFACNRMFQDAWMDFPRYLSKKEFCNPYPVFRRFFAFVPLEIWLDYWTGAIDRALCPERSTYPLSELKICTQLLKLIEAAHLIDVREVAHVSGSLKTHYRGRDDEEF